MEKESLTYKTFKNSSYSIFGYFWPIIFTLTITPIIILTLGVKDYGIFLFINSAMGLFGLFELGFSVAVLKYLSYYYGKNDKDSLIRLTHSANLLFLILGLLGLVISIIIGVVGVSILPESFSEYEKYSSLFIFAGGVSFFTVITSTYSLILQATQRFDISTKIGIIAVTLSNLATLIVVKLGWGLTGIFSIQLLSSFILFVVIFYYAKKILPLATFKFAWHKKEIIECYRFGIVAYVNNIANYALSYLDKLVIPFYAGPSNLTYYSMPGNITTKIPGITNTLTVGMLPSTSQLSGSDDILRMKVLYVRTFRLITIVAGALTVTLISFSYKILEYWLSSDFAEKSSTVFVILAFTNFILALFGPLSSFLLGLGKLKFLSISSVCMALLNAVALFTLLPLYGIVGAAWAYLISILPVFYLFYYVESRYLRLPNRKRYYTKTIFGTIVTASVIVTFNFFISQFVSNLFMLLIVIGVSSVLYVIVYKLFGFFEEEDWRDLKYFFFLFLNRFK